MSSSTPKSFRIMIGAAIGIVVLTLPLYLIDVGGMFTQVALAQESKHRPHPVTWQVRNSGQITCRLVLAYQPPHYRDWWVELERDTGGDDWQRVSRQRLAIERSSRYTGDDSSVTAPPTIRVDFKIGDAAVARSLSGQRVRLRFSHEEFGETVIVGVPQEGRLALQMVSNMPGLTPDTVTQATPATPSTPVSAGSEQTGQDQTEQEPTGSDQDASTSPGAGGAGTDTTSPSASPSGETVTATEVESPSPGAPEPSAPAPAPAP